MSRSKKKTPIHGVTTAASESRDKELWHRAYRRGERQRLAHDDDPLPASAHDYSSPWTMDKDGKAYIEGDPVLMRK